jgi:hypothetical protein
MATASIGDATFDSNVKTQTDGNSNDSESSSGFVDKQVEFARMFVSSKHMMVSSPASELCYNTAISRRDETSAPKEGLSYNFLKMTDGYDCPVGYCS